MEKHRANCQRGASILVGVCRGKLSEGYDYPDDLARVVFIVGVPFPNIKDPKIIIKRHYYVKDDNKWLVDQTMRAVNQSLGRVIRHVKDYGALYLIDQRYTQGFKQKAIKHDFHNKYTSRISFWLRERL